MSDISEWFATEADNNALTPPHGLPEGATRMREINDAFREMQAALRRMHLDSCGVVGTMTGNVMAIAGARPLAAYHDGLAVTVLPTAANTGAVTAAYRSLAALPVRLITNEELVAGDLIANGPLSLIHRQGVWRVLSVVGTVARRKDIDQAAVPLRIPVGSFFWSLNATDPAVVLGYGTWTVEKGYLVAAGTYQDAYGYWQTFTAGQYTGANYLNFATDGNAQGAQGGHDHGTFNHQHDISHGHNVSAHQHQISSHAHTMAHQHLLPNGTLMEVPFGTAGSYRLRMGPSDTSNIVSVLPYGVVGYSPTTGEPTNTATGPSGTLTTSQENANVAAYSGKSSYEAVDVAPSSPAGIFPSHPYARVAYRWSRTA